MYDLIYWFYFSSLIRLELIYVFRLILQAEDFSQAIFVIDIDTRTINNKRAQFYGRIAYKRRSSAIPATAINI